uniref:Uncharacterized protein n=1 Tax=Arundo donax TaxID=35708 RepID=A0A0A9E4Q3_ARUDO
MNLLQLAVSEVRSQLLLPDGVIFQLLPFDFHPKSKNILSHYLNQLLNFIHFSSRVHNKERDGV